MKGWLMYIGEVSATTGASKKAIRYYESLGLLPTVNRKGTYRVYEDSDVIMIRLIMHAKALGFKLSELSPLLKEISNRSSSAIDSAYRLIAKKQSQLELELANIHHKISDLELLNNNVGRLLDESFNLRK